MAPRRYLRPLEWAGVVFDDVPREAAIVVLHASRPIGAVPGVVELVPVETSPPATPCLWDPFVLDRHRLYGTDVRWQGRILSMAVGLDARTALGAYVPQDVQFHFFRLYKTPLDDAGNAIAGAVVGEAGDAYPMERAATAPPRLPVRPFSTSEDGILALHPHVPPDGLRDFLTFDDRTRLNLQVTHLAGSTIAATAHASARVAIALWRRDLSYEEAPLA